jgi:hypothetical protein
MNAKRVNLDSEKSKAKSAQEEMDKPWLSGLGCGRALKMPLRLQCDLLIIGDLVSAPQLKMFYRHLKSQSVMNQAQQYGVQPEQRHNNHHNNNNQQQSQQHQLHFNPVKKFKSIKFIRGGTIDNIRTALQMHDSIKAPVILMHVGDEDVFKTRSSATTVERVKDLTSLVKEYCPDSFVMLSTLMRRMSKTENIVTNEVNKGVVSFCKLSKEIPNAPNAAHYMLNNNFDPDYHTYEGRSLTNKGLKLYVENMLFVVDYFLIKKNKQN